MPDQQQAGERPAALLFEKFGGVNTATTRPGVPDEMAYWLDGWMPLAPRNLRTLYGLGPLLYNSASLIIVCAYSYNIGANPYHIVFLSDGSTVQINTATGAVTQVMAAGTIIAPSITTIGVSQYGEQYLIIVALQANGYWVWDGNILYGAGTLTPTVTLTDVGSGYATAPIVTATGGSGSGATFTATISGGSVVNVTVTNPGHGYSVGDVPVLVFTGGNSAGTGASFTAVMSHLAGGSGATFTVNLVSIARFTYTISSVTVNTAGSGYTGLTTATVTILVQNAVVTNPAVLSVVVGAGGAITSVTVIYGGVYTTPLGGTPSLGIALTDPGYFYVSSVTINSGGHSYTPGTTITASGGSPYSQAVLAPVISGGVITSVTVVSTGAYSSATPPALTVANTVTNAAGTISLMPYGIDGNAVQTYQGHVWVFAGSTFSFSAPGSVWDFATSDGGGSDQSSVNYLRVSYTQAISTNGFLFLIGDSSMDYISGVNTTTPQGGSPTTTFTQSNSDPEQGTPYPASVTTLGQDIVLANSTGVFVSSGGAFSKKSEALDGIWNSVPHFGGQQLSAAKATIFSKRVWMVLVPIIDPVSSERVNKLLMWNGRQWWASVQDVPLVFIWGQEIDSVYTAWGTDGHNIYPLFQEPSSAFTKTAQSRLWDTPNGYDYAKSVVNLFAIVQFYGVSELNYTVSIDNETGLANTYTGSATTVTWENEFGASVTWENSVPEVIQWLSTSALAILPPTAVGQWGVLNGMTITTDCDDMALITAMLQPGVVEYRA